MNDEYACFPILQTLCQKCYFNSQKSKFNNFTNFMPKMFISIHKKVNLTTFSEIMNHNSKLKVAKLSDRAIVPTKGSNHAAGFDLYSAHDYELHAGGKVLVKTDIQIEVPSGTYGRIAPRSGLAWNNHIDIGAGVIDRDYRGNVGVVMFNHSEEPFSIKTGDRVAQLICEKIVYADVLVLDSLDETKRGDGGFGSTGVV